MVRAAGATPRSPAPSVSMPVSRPQGPAAPVGRRHLLPALIAALGVLAWVSIALWSASPYARYLDHRGWLDAAWLQAVCDAVPQGSLVVPAVLHTGAWLLMIVAMMLPTTLPLLNVFARITSGRPQAGSLFALVVLGYMAAWGAF